MTTTRKVRLEGGPRHDDVVEINALLKATTLNWEEETLERDWDGTTVYTTRVGLATYRESADDPDVWEFVPTPTALGDMTRILRGDR